MHPSQTDYYLVSLRVNGCYLWFNIMQIFITVGFIACLYLNLAIVVAILQIVITFMIAIDLIVRYFTEGSKLFIRSWDNCFNIVILLLLIAAVTSDLVAPVLTRYDNGAMTGLFLFLRYAVQISRLCRLVVDSKNVLQLAKEQTITLNLNDTIEDDIIDGSK